MSIKPHILITRPKGQHQPFVKQLMALGLSVSHLPCLDIEPLNDSLLNVDTLNRYDRVLFTSVNAVWQAHQHCPLPWPGLAVNAIGSATGNALARLGQPLSFEPLEPFNSEAFLCQIAVYKPGRLLLVKGEGGRSTLIPGLQNLGWNVTHVDVYRRRLPSFPAAEIEHLLTQPTPDLISTTSNESLQNFMVLAAEHLPALLKRQLVVNSARAAELARTLGFEHAALVATPAGDQGQLKCIKHWLDIN